MFQTTNQYHIYLEICVNFPRLLLHLTTFLLGSGRVVEVVTAPRSSRLLWIIDAKDHLLSPTQVELISSNYLIYNIHLQ